MAVVFIETYGVEIAKAFKLRWQPFGGGDTEMVDPGYLCNPDYNHIAGNIELNFISSRSLYL